MKAVIYAGSHRKGGNSDHAAELLAQGVTNAGGKADIFHIRDYQIEHCLACGFCDKHIEIQGMKRCVFGTKDQAWDLFEPMLTAPVVFFASPIYFYHLPSRLKTWIDRGQQFWTAQRTGEPWIADLPKRTAHAVLVAGQPTGGKLFEGSRLSLKYFAQNFNMDLPVPLSFHGIDQSGDLEKQARFEAEIISLGERGWRESR